MENHVSERWRSALLDPVVNRTLTASYVAVRVQRPLNVGAPATRAKYHIQSVQGAELPCVVDGEASVTAGLRTNPTQTETFVVSGLDRSELFHRWSRSVLACTSLS